MQQNAFFSLEQVIDRQHISVSVETPLNKAIALMHHHGNHCTVAEREANNAVRGNSSCILVVEGKRLRGIFTERDLVKLIAKGIDTQNATVGEMMTENVVTIVATDDQDIFSALTLLKKHRIRHLPIIDESQNLLGLITAKSIRQKLQPINLMKWRKVAEVMESMVIYAAPDESIRSIASLMADNQISCVAIAETQPDSDTDRLLVQPIGIITERDIVQFQNLNLDLELPARDYMSTPLFLVNPEDSLWDIYQQMKQRRVRRLLVEGDRGELAGIVTQSSLLQVFDPTEMYGAIEVLQRQLCQLETEREVLLQERNSKLEREVKAGSMAIAYQNQELQVRLRQQQVVAEIGTFALTAKNLLSISQRVVELVASILDVEYCKVLELSPNGKELLLKAGVGWHHGLVGTAIVRADTNSQAGYTLLHSEPVIVDDLNSETRFTGPPLLTQHRVVSGVSVIIPDTGKPYGILGVHTTQHRLFTQNDINFIQAIANILAQAHERFQAETALQASKQKFDSILGSLNDIVWSVDAQTFKLLYINQAAEKIYGYRVAEFYQNDNLWLEVVHPEDRDRVSEFPHRALETGTQGIEYRIVRSDGEIRWLLDRANVTYDADNRPLRLDGNSTDITERKQAEVLLKESQERYTLAVEGSSSGLWDWNVTTNEVFYAPRFKEILGCTDADLANTFEAWSNRLHPEDRDRVLETVQNHLESEVLFDTEYRLLKQDGDYCWVQARGQAIWNEVGEVVRMAGSITDISDRKHRENILKDIASGVTISTGADFLSSLVSYLCQALKADFAFIGELIQPEKDRIKTLAAYGNGQIIDNFEYLKAGTPCKSVLENRLCVYPKAIAQIFPEDLMLQDISAESYAGITITDSNGKDLGLIAVLDSKPCADAALTEEVLKIFATCAANELERQQAETDLQQSNQILQAISSIQTQFLTDVEAQVIFDGMLENLLELTESEYGFIGEIHVADDGSRTMSESYMKFRGRPFLKTHAITNIAWNEETRAFYAENAPKGMEFHNLQTLFGAVIVTGEPVIANSPRDDPRRGGLPDGHPPLNAFLGIPFYKNGQMTGMAGIANRKGGYDESTIEYLRPLLDTCSRVIEAYKSERQRQQTEAKNREQAALLNLTHDTVLVRDMDNNITFWNLGAEEMYGWSADEAIGKKSHELLQAKFSQSTTEIKTELFQQNRWEGELTHQKQDGSTVIVMSRWSLLRDEAGNPQQILEINHDITRRKHAEARIREQAALLNVATDAIMVRDLENQLLFWNQGAEKIYGWTEAEVLNRNANELLYQESLVRFDEILRSLYQRGQWQGELQQVTKAGENITVESRWALVKDESGNPESFLIVNTDITEQKQLEAQFLRTQRLESLGTLAGGIAHDLNNILAPILGFSKLLPLKLPDVDEQTKGFFKIMENNANRGTALVKQILTFSRGLEGEKGIVQIRHLIAEIAQIINETFPKSIQLETNAPKNLWTVNADVNQLHQVLINLSVNARDAMTEGGTLTINAENTTVDAEYARLHLDAAEGDYVCITVRDTGVGISPEVIDRIFEPFFTTKEVGRGTGLGLSTVIGIIRGHGGFVDVISDCAASQRHRQRSNEGTKFKVFLPASDIAEKNLEEIEEDLHGNGELVLVVDDETAILEVTKATLETYNYQVLTASDGIKAIATYAQNQENIRAVIMDIMMPTMDGKTAIRTLKQINPELKIIAVSGLIERQEIVSELDSNVTAFMNKPYSNDDLLRTIRELLHA